jgi:hypothetical protein
MEEADSLRGAVFFATEVIASGFIEDDATYSHGLAD